MNVQELKEIRIAQLVRLAKSLGIDGVSLIRRPELVQRVVQEKVRNGERVVARGVLELLPEGYGFLRSPEQSYLPGPDDIYVSPNIVRRFGLDTGHMVTGPLRPPRRGEKYFALAEMDFLETLSADLVTPRKKFEDLIPWLYLRG